MLINGEDISTSGFYGSQFRGSKSSIGLLIVKNLFKIWHEVEMIIIGEIINYFRFFKSHFGSPKTPYWSFGTVEKMIRIWK